jgi:predicted nucleic acid-binding protein
MALVVDASIVLAWGLPDESSAYADAVLSVVEREGLHVPELWPREVANGLAFLTALSHLRIEVEEAPDALIVIRDGTAAAMRYGLTAYDAAYVDLAEREGLILATIDKPMREAAERSGITVFR